ncbi:MAG: hypothetical protein KAI66_28025 [Lentisphaeria bacterium]|nr:hypothetical protein [Lentisphaeria bacterium]
MAKLNGTAVELTLKPENGKLEHKAGQFLFVGFKGDRVLGEPHPFTISSAPGEESLRLAIRASGDFTQHLYDNLAEGTQAVVDGSYGRFDHTTGGDKQIWIAGGIGVTPFLSWLRSMDGEAACDVDFFYSVRVAEDALYLEELQAVDKAFDWFRLHVSFSSRDGHLTAEKITEISGSPIGKDIYLCGPVAMVESLRRQLVKLGVSQGNMHHEEFSFR